MPTALTSPKRTVQITVGIPFGGHSWAVSEPWESPAGEAFGGVFTLTVFVFVDVRLKV